MHPQVHFEANRPLGGSWAEISPLSHQKQKHHIRGAFCFSMVLEMRTPDTPNKSPSGVRLPPQRRVGAQPSEARPLVRRHPR